MISFDTYQGTISSKGRYLGEVRKVDADRMIDKTFTLDHNFRIVYVQLSDEEYEKADQSKCIEHNGMYFERRDAKYQKHAAQSILADSVDYYLQFRPGVTASIGRYVIIPDDQSFEPDINDINQWWLLVLKNDLRQFPRYMVLRCNWNFQWIHNGSLHSCLGCLRNASSYTSGIWTADISTTTDDITSAWLPFTDDTATIRYDYRFMVSNNKIHPRVFKTSKVEDTIPAGLLKLVFKQDFYNEDRDNIELRICDYYDEYGNERIGTTDDSIIIEDAVTISCAHSTLQNRGTYRKIMIDSDISFSPVWSWSSVITSDESAYTLSALADGCRIIANRNIDLVGDYVTVTLSDETGVQYGQLTLEVV